MQRQSIMGQAPGIPACDMSLGELLLHALVIELEAAQRYQQLAEMMGRFGNTKVEKIFAKMSNIEANHAETIEEHIKGRNLPMLTPSQFRWRGIESPENADSGRLFHLMTPCQALALALDSEKRAYEFFADVVDDCADERIREIAAEFAAEEEQHIAWVEEWLADVNVTGVEPN